MEDESLTKTEKTKNVYQSLFSDFAKNTTAHGLVQLVINKRVSVRLLWILVILVCQVVLYYQIYPLFLNYLERPTKTKIDLEYENSQIFPRVTLCTTNPVRKSMSATFVNDDNILRKKLKLNEDDEQDDEKTKVEDDGDFDNDEYVKDERDCDDDEYVKDERDCDDDGTIEYGEDSDLTATDESKKMYFKKYEVLSKLGNLAQHNGKDILKYGNQFNEIFQNCTWRGYYDCSDDWKPVWHWRYGNCFAYNMANLSSINKIRKARGVGPESGLSVMLSIDREEIDDDVTQTSAIIVHVGEQGSRIEPYMNGFNLAPNYAHYIGLSKTKMKRADPFQNNSCISHSQIPLGNRSFSQQVISKYSIYACRDICVATEQIKNCGCSSYWLPSLSGNRTCDDRNADFKCKKKILQKAADNQLSCLKNCRLPCHEVIYEKEVSSRKFLWAKEEKYYDYFKVTVYFKTLETRTTENKRYYFIQNLLADIGGQLGLFSGLSVLTVIEFTFLFGSLIANLFCLSRLGNHNRKNASASHEMCEMERLA